MPLPTRDDANGPGPLATAPPRDTTPLPSSFALQPDPSTRTFDDGTVLMGGAPLRLWRLTPRANTLLEHWRTGATVGRGKAAQLLARRLASAGAFVPQPGKGSMTADDVTVVIPVRDRHEQLDRLLAALSPLTCIVVDDASRDATRTKDIATGHGARFIGLPSNDGPAAARNKGAQAATSPLIAFIDSDITPTDSWLAPLLAWFDDPLVAAVAPRVVPAPNGKPDSLTAYETVRSALDRGNRTGIVRPQSPIPFVPSATLLVRREVVGLRPFDERLRVGEDVDLVWRLDAAGWDVRFDPSSTVHHDGPTDARAFVAQRMAYGESAAPLSERHPEVMAPLRASAWSAAVWGLLAARRPLAASATLAGTVLTLAKRLSGLVHDPVDVAGRIAGGGTLQGALPALGGLTRAWAPGLAMGLCSRRTRKAAAAAFLLPALRDWQSATADGSPLTYVGWHALDDLAYGIGVWRGCLRQRTLRPLVPKLEVQTRVWSAEGLRRQLRTEAPAEEAPAAKA